MRRRKAPISASGGGFTISLGEDESALLLRLLDELRSLLTDPEPTPQGATLLVRLFPVVHPDDDEAEAEYQRFMRDDLVQSRLAAIAVVEDVLADAKSRRRLDEAQVIAFMQAINSIRLVLGTMLGVSDDPAIAEVDDEFEDSPEYHLYAYLSWLLENAVQALSGR